MGPLKVLGVIILMGSVGASPFVNLKLGGGTGLGSGVLMNKVKEIGEKVYESKREFINGVNEKISNLLWIPPLPSATTETPTTEKQSEWIVEERNDKLVFPSNDELDDYETPNLAIYARSSFLSPDDLVDSRDKPNVAISVKNNFNLFGKSG
uniref:Putative conserved secreted protein n=1 Tax=Culex tarsalis TaxID=7177 RepID=A0A1Q3G576_CULTA